MVSQGTLKIDKSEELVSERQFFSEMLLSNDNSKGYIMTTIVAALLHQPTGLAE
jgi:hypothetical protein